MPTPAETILEFLSGRRSLILSTLDDAGLPHISYAPFVPYAEGYCLFISEAAHHTRHLRERPDCSALFIEDEAEAAQIFARRRLMLQCRAERIARDDVRFGPRIAAMHERFGDIVAMLEGLRDFQLFELTPRCGEAVFGFGDAYTIEHPFDRITPKRTGHQR